MTPFAALGLPDDADERAVKREYARRLKALRPDEDADGFQSLHATYQHALRWLEHRARQAMHEEATDAPPLAQSQPTHATAPAAAKQTAVEPEVALDFDAFIEALIPRLQADDPDALRAWLDAFPALWSLALKNAVGPAVIQSLHQSQTAMRDAQFDVVLSFFGLDTVDRRIDHQALGRLRERLHLHWQLRDARRFQWHMRMRGVLMTEREARRTLRQLTRPFSWLQAFVFALWPAFATRMRSILLRLSDHGRTALPPSIPETQARYWVAVTDQDMSWAKFQVGLGRTVVYGAILAGIVAAMPGHPWGVALGLFGTVLGSGLAYMACANPIRRYFAWQGAPESTRTRWPLLRTLWVPLLSLASVMAVVVGFDSSAMLGGLALSALAMITAVWRYHRRIGVDYVYLYMAIAIAFAPFAFVIALIFWGRDAFRHRRDLQWQWRTANA